MSNKLIKTAGEIFGITGAVGAFVLILFFLLILGPWLLFWSVGILAAAAGFHVAIPLTGWTWLAAVVLLGLVRGGK